MAQEHTRASAKRGIELPDLPPTGREPLTARLRRHVAESGASDRSFGLTAGVVFLGIAFLPLARREPVHIWALWVAALSFGITWLRPEILRRPKQAWLLFGFLAASVVNPIVLGVLYYAVVAPAGLLKRLFGKDSLDLRFDSQAATYWKPRAAPPGSMKEQF